MTQEEILQLVSNNLKYNAYVYNQLSTLVDTWDGDYKIEYLYESIPDNSLLFMVPKYSSLATVRTDDETTPIEANKLTIRYLIGTKVIDGVKRGVYSSKSYKIYVESPEGTMTLATIGDIIAHRLAIFRFIKGDTDSVILVNSPLYNSVSLSTLTVTNKAAFYQRPVIVDKITGAEVPLATNTDLLALTKRVETLENKFQYGTEDAEDALVDAEVGTIYIQVEEGE